MCTPWGSDRPAADCCLCSTVWLSLVAVFCDTLALVMSGYLVIIATQSLETFVAVQVRAGSVQSGVAACMQLCRSSHAACRAGVQHPCELGGAEG